MSEDIVIRILLQPLALLYGLGVGLRNLLYRIGVLRIVRFDLPVISVGNLSIGGAGKSPHIEYMLRWLDQYVNVAVLSRGYGRKGSHLHEVSANDTAEAVGDEPLQIKGKFPAAHVFVGTDRGKCIKAIHDQLSGAKAVLLDDAFQHRRLNASLTSHLHQIHRTGFGPK